MRLAAGLAGGVAWNAAGGELLPRALDGTNMDCSHSSPQGSPLLPCGTYRARTLQQQHMQDASCSGWLLSPGTREWAGCSVRRTNSLEQRRSRLQDLAIAHHQFSSCARTLKSGCIGRASVLSGLARTELVERWWVALGSTLPLCALTGIPLRVLMLGQRRVEKKLGVLILDPWPHPVPEISASTYRRCPLHVKENLSLLFSLHALVSRVGNSSYTTLVDYLVEGGTIRFVFSAAASETDTRRGAPYPGHRHHVVESSRPLPRP
jgi:hypothetical protein